MEEEESNSSSVEQILDLLYAAGYVDAACSDAPPSRRIAGGLSWCIAALMQVSLNHDDDTRGIEESLRLVGCPHPLRPSHLQDLDTRALFPVIQWVTSHLPLKREHRVNQVCHAENTSEVEECRTMNETLGGNLDELNHRKMNVVKQLNILQDRINKEGADSAVQKLVSIMTSLKDLEKQQNYFLSSRDSKHAELQADISELERKITNDSNSENLSDGLHCSFNELIEKVNLMKKQLAAQLRDIVAVRRRIDDLPCQSEVIQYERRLSELYAQIQFQDAFSSPDGRIKLVHSMEGIVKGSQQKLERVQVGLQEEERILNDLKQRYAASTGEQKHLYSLLKAFQIGFLPGPMCEEREVWVSKFRVKIAENLEVELHNILYCVCVRAEVASMVTSQYIYLYHHGGWVEHNQLQFKS
ncbi:hypothetical protein Fmac_000799 [Flemingia macrophylla]|uniref:Coiled-coil domain-containing protein 93 n=1 Tax=Flemingia macrophylla TaxID=520843 RepID=A0ABD1NFB5_9FABA